jgi:hypothetical protein
MNMIVGTAIAGSAIACQPAAAADDPIFALIESHRAAQAAHNAACREQSRREETLIDEGIGLCPFVTMVWQGRPIISYTHKQIDSHWGAVDDKIIARAHTEFDAVIARYEEVFGNIENEAGDLGDFALDKFDDLISTTPTTARGARALLDYLLEEVADLDQQFLEEDKLVALLSSINETLQALHPEA